MQTYLNGLCAELARAGIGEERHADLRTSIEPLRLPSESGVSLALIVNELVMNALKHGRSQHRPAMIDVRLTRLDSNQARLTIADNGPGLGNASQSANGLGTRLIGMLVRQLRVQLDIEDSAEGYAAHVTFPLETLLKWEQTS
jgi:two-component sensor histidine kinase